MNFSLTKSETNMMNMSMLTRRFSVGSLLSLGTLGCACLCSYRAFDAQSPDFLFLGWNLFLAWIPFLFASLARNSFAHHGRIRTGTVVLSLLWLLFFPNALYIVTDFVHLHGGYHSARFWYDLVMIFTCAFTGLTLGYLSLYRVQAIVQRAYGRLVGWCFAFGSLVLAAFGVYLGRFLRWNSWDVFVAPEALLRDILRPLIDPFAHADALLFTTLFAAFFILMYVVSMAILAGSEDSATQAAR